MCVILILNYPSAVLIYIYIYIYLGRKLGLNPSGPVEPGHEQATEVVLFLCSLSVISFSLLLTR